MPHQKGIAPELMFLSERMPQLSIIDLKVHEVAITFRFQLCSAGYTNEEQQEKHFCNQSSNHKNMDDSRSPTINYMAFTLHFHLFSACYTALQMKMPLQSI